MGCGHLLCVNLLHSMISKFWLAFLVLYLYKIFSISTKCLLKLLSSEHPITLCVDSLCHLSVTLPLALPPQPSLIAIKHTKSLSCSISWTTSLFHVSAWLAWTSNITFYHICCFQDTMLPVHCSRSPPPLLMPLLDIFAARRATRTAFFWPNSPAGSEQPGLHTQLKVF